MVGMSFTSPAVEIYLWEQSTVFKYKQEHSESADLFHGTQQ